MVLIRSMNLHKEEMVRVLNGREEELSAQNKVLHDRLRVRESDRRALDRILSLEKRTN